MIEVDSVSYVIAGRRILDRVRLGVDAGELVAIVGPNGAGKSTLLATLAGDLCPTSGAVRLGGRALREIPAREVARVRAVLPQSGELSFPMPCLDVVLLGRSPHVEGRETAHDVAIARLAMSQTDTLGLAERPFTTLSGGEKQRVHAARAFAQVWEGAAARALLLDEPTNNLDLLHQHTLLARARRMADEGAAVVAVLHDLALAARYADRVAVLDAGALVALGPPADVLTPRLFADVFGVFAVAVDHPALDHPLVVPTGPARPDPGGLR